ncbi:hypothetical protein FACS1894166_00230 [Bacilli bacterium]|nr:hypothetical protein FACS1894166_00230 [Bacilli bacterium]
MNNGVKPINDVIDRLAYITLLTNIPTAIYDASKITNDFVIAKANSNDSFIGFDNNKYNLSINDIVVKSNNTIVSLAGIIGGADFGVNDHTKDVVIELANFNNANIRSTSLKLNLNTDAARRFGKPISNYAIELAISFIYKQFTGYQVSAPITKLPKAPLVKVTLDLPYVQQLLGTTLSLDSIKENLKAYGFIFDGDTCFVPLYRQDIVTSQDISEEILKFLNINELLEAPIQYDLGKLNNNYEYYLTSQIKSILNGNFINEVKTYNLVSEQRLNTFNLYKYTTPIKIDNSHNLERAYFRTNLINEMLKIYEYNASYKTSLQPIFEIQKIYGNENELSLTVLSSDTINLDHISKSKLNVNVNYLKAIANQIADLFGIKFEYLHTTETGIFYRNEELAIRYSGRLIGYIGLIKQTMLQPYSLHDKNIYCLSLNLSMLLNLYHPTRIKFNAINKLQPVFKDVSFFINDGEKIENLLNALKLLPFIDSYKFIDRYVNADEQVSYTIEFKFVADKTINTKTIDDYLNQIYQKMVESNCIVRK